MPRRDQRGVMLMHAIVMMALVSVVVAVVTGALIARTSTLRSATASIQATYAAESGIAATVAALRAGEGLDVARRGQIAGCAWRVSLRGAPSSGAVTLESTGECAGRRQTVVYSASGTGWSLRRTR